MRFALVEAVEVVEPQAGRPAVERTGRADVRLRRVVPLAEHARGVAVVAQHLRHQRRAPRDDARVAGVAGAHLDDDAGADAVMIAAGEQRAARRAAERRGVEAGVLQPVLGELVHVRRRHRPAERRAHAEADVVEQDEQHIRAALGRLDRLRIARASSPCTSRRSCL